MRKRGEQPPELVIEAYGSDDTNAPMVYGLPEDSQNPPLNEGERQGGPTRRDIFIGLATGVPALAVGRFMRQLESNPPKEKPKPSELLMDIEGEKEREALRRQLPFEKLSVKAKLLEDALLGYDAAQFKGRAWLYSTAYTPEEKLIKMGYYSNVILFNNAQLKLESYNHLDPGIPVALVGLPPKETDPAALRTFSPDIFMLHGHDPDCRIALTDHYNIGTVIEPEALTLNAANKHVQYGPIKLEFNDTYRDYELRTDDANGYRIGAFNEAR